MGFLPLRPHGTGRAVSQSRMLANRGGSMSMSDVGVGDMPGRDEWLDAKSLVIAELLCPARKNIHLHTGGNTFRDTAPWPERAPDIPWMIYATTAAREFTVLAADFDTKSGDAVRHADSFCAV